MLFVMLRNMPHVQRPPSFVVSTQDMAPTQQLEGRGGMGLAILELTRLLALPI